MLAAKAADRLNGHVELGRAGPEATRGTRSGEISGLGVLVGLGLLASILAADQDSHPRGSSGRKRSLKKHVKKTEQALPPVGKAPPGAPRARSAGSVHWLRKSALEILLAALVLGTATFIFLCAMLHGRPDATERAPSMAGSAASSAASAPSSTASTASLPSRPSAPRPKGPRSGRRVCGRGLRLQERDLERSLSCSREELGHRFELRFLEQPVEAHVAASAEDEAELILDGADDLLRSRI